jgi:hypothetical protein
MLLCQIISICFYLFPPSALSSTPRVIIPSMSGLIHRFFSKPVPPSLEPPSLVQCLAFLQGAAHHQQGLFVLDCKKYEDEVNLVFEALQANKPFDLSKTSSPGVVAQVLLRVMDGCSPPIFPQETFPALCALGSSDVDPGSASAAASADILLVFSTLSRKHRVRATYLFQFLSSVIDQASAESRVHLAEDMASSICEAAITSAVKCKMESGYFSLCRGGVKNLLLNCGLISGSIPVPLELAVDTSSSLHLGQTNENGVDLKLGQHCLHFQPGSASWLSSSDSASPAQNGSSCVALRKDTFIRQLQQDCNDLQQMKFELQSSVSELEEQFLAQHHRYN